MGKMETVSLSARVFEGPGGAGCPLVLLHGLLGSSRNWQTVGSRLAAARTVFALDLRNHGASPHSKEMPYAAMAEDVRVHMKGAGLSRYHLVGHSMGGKVAMHLACSFPDQVATLTVVDIAPRAYPPRWEREFAVMRRMPVAQFTKRAEAEAWLEDDIRDWAFRKFLVTNLERAPGGGFHWIVNLEILERSLPGLFRQVPEGEQGFKGPTLFLRGGKSKFVADSDRSLMERYFPNYTLETVAEAGHNVHFDAPEAFVSRLSEHFAKGDG